MSTQTPFSDQTPEQTPPGEEQQAEASSNEQPNAFDNLLGNIKAEDGRQKYNSVEDALNSIPHAQEHINTLNSKVEEMQRQLEEQREQLSKAKGVEDVLERLQQNKGTDEPSVNSLDEQKVLELARLAYQQDQAQEVAKGNVRSVVDTLTETFCSAKEAEQAYVEKAAELGVTLDFFNDMAAKSPKAVLGHFGDKGKPAPTKTQGSVNTEAFSQPNREAPKGRSPMLVGTSTSDLLGEWNRIGEKYKD